MRTACLGRSASTRRSARAPFWERSAFAIESGVVAVARGVALVVGMDAQVTSQLVTAAEAFVTAWMRACMWLFTRVRSNVARLVLQPIEGSSAQRALVRPWNLRFVHRK